MEEYNTNANSNRCTLVVERKNKDMEKGSGVNQGLGEEESYIQCDREKE